MARAGSAIVVLASGSGSNFAALVEAFPGRVRFLLCNRKEARVCARALLTGVPYSVVDDRDFPSRSDHETAVIETLRSAEADQLKGLPCCLVLAGYMRILSGTFLLAIHEIWPDCRIINLHPADLGTYKGPAGYTHAVAQRFPYWRLTVHEVTEVLDDGPVLFSREFPVFPWEGADQLHERLQPQEHSLLVQAVREVCTDLSCSEKLSDESRKGKG